METYINPGMPSKPRFSANRRTRQRPHRLSHLGTCPDRVSRGSDVRVGIARDMPPKLFEDQRRLVVGACAERVVKVGCGRAALTHDGSGWSAFVRTVGQHRGSDAYRTDAAWRSKSEERATTPWRPVGATTGHAPVGIPRMGCLPAPIPLPSSLQGQAKLGRMSERGAKPVQVQPRTRVALPQKPDGPANPTLRRPAP